MDQRVAKPPLKVVSKLQRLLNLLISEEDVMREKDVLHTQVQVPDHDKNHSEIMEIAFHHIEDGRKITRIAWAIALYLTLAILWAPGLDISPNLPEVLRVDNKPVVRKVLRPPPDTPIQRAETKKRNAKKVPMPDLTPNEPEPFVEPEPPPAPEILPTDDWEIGIPDAPPDHLLQREEQVARVGQIGVEPPIFVKKVHPDYPDMGRRLKITGYVVLEAILRKNGEVDDVKVLRGIAKGKFGFEEEAIKALHGWEFLPGKVNNRPADVRMTLKIDFQFKKPSAG